MLGLTRQASTGSSVHNGVFNTPISTLSFYLAAVSSLAVPIVREVGGSYQPASIWEANRFTFQTSLGRLATALSLIQLFIYLALLFRAVSTRNNKHLLLSVVAVGGFAVYSFIEFSGYHSDVFTVLSGSVSTTLFLIPLFVLLGEDDVLVMAARKVAPTIASIGMILSFVFAIRFHLACGIGSTVGWCPARDIFSYSICCLWASICLLNEKEFPYSKRIAMCCLMTLVALLLSVRSWVIQAAILAVYCSLFSSAEGTNFRTRRFVMAAFIVIIVVAVSSQVVPEVFETFSERIFDDTRSGQYETFFAQVNPASLIVGSGAAAGYQYGDNTSYPFFDNQFVYLCFHFGLIPVLCLVWALLKTIFITKDKTGTRSREQCFCALAYVLALCGLSTFFSYEINVGIAILFLALGYRAPTQRSV